VTKVQLLEVEQGQDWQQTVLYEDSNGTPISVTGYTAKMTVARTPGAQSIIDLTDGNGRIQLGGANGTVKLKLSAAETEGIVPAGDLAYDLKLYAPGGTVVKLLKGTFKLFAGVTKG
jgi:hypothetical protein